VCTDIPAVDLTMRAGLEPKNGNSEPNTSTDNVGDEERGFNGRSSHNIPLSIPRPSSSPSTSGERDLHTRPSSAASSFADLFKKKNASRFFDSVNLSQKTADAPVTPKLAMLVSAYFESDIASAIRRETADIRIPQRNGERSNDLPDDSLESSIVTSRKRASWGTQFRILSGRAFKNLYRDPALLTAHYLSSIALACECYFVSHNFSSRAIWSVICGFFFRNVT
jgi:hypothetical protein